MAAVIFGALLAAVVVVGFSRDKAPVPAQPPQRAPKPATALKEPKPAMPQTVQISVDSSPQGAQIVGPKGDILGVTPQTLVLKQGAAAQALALRLEGYRPAAVTVIPDINKPIFVRLEAAPLLRSKPSGRPAPKPRQKAVPVDPFAD